MEAGELVPDDLITRLLVARLDTEEVRAREGLAPTGSPAAHTPAALP